ncbi:MAG: protein phosphatase 2C domain-containing protein, partial [Eubacteriales bacterium]
MLFYGKTDVGKRRAVNQDNFIIKKYSPDVLFAVVCDGMGGANGGNVASSLAAETFAARVDKYESEHQAFFGLSEEDILDLLSDAATEANRVVYRRAASDITLSGMGTTLVG